MIPAHPLARGGPGRLGVLHGPENVATMRTMGVYERGGAGAGTRTMFITN